MDQQEKKHTPKLASAQELRGKKSGSSAGKGGKKKLWLSVIGLVVILGIAVGIYVMAQKVNPTEPETTEPAATSAPSTTVKIISNEITNVEYFTVAVKGEEPYTIVNLVGLEEDKLAEVVAANTPEGAEPVDVSTLGECILQGDAGFDLDASSVRTQLEYCANMTATSLVETGVKDLTPFGLAQPQVKVTMVYRDGTSQVLCIGDKVPTSNSYYVTPEGSGEVYVLYSRPFTAYNKTRNQLHTVVMNMPFTSSTEVREFSITRQGEEPLHIRYLGEGESTVSISSLVMVEPFWYNVNSDRVTEIMDAIVAMGITSYAGERSELPDCGLDEPRYVVTANNGDEGEMTYKVGAFAGTDTVYVQVDDTESVYLADATTLAFLDKVSPSYLVDQFANLVYINYVDTVEVSGDGVTHVFSIHREPILDANGEPTLDSRGNVKTDDTYFVDGEPIDESVFKKIYQEIIGTLVSKINDDLDYQGEVVATVKYTLNKEPGEFEVQYMAYDSDFYAVHRDNVSLFLIKQSKIHAMIQNIENWLASAK